MFVMKRFLIFLAVLLTTVSLAVGLMWIGGGYNIRDDVLRDTLLFFGFVGAFLGAVVQIDDDGD